MAVSFAPFIAVAVFAVFAGCMSTPPANDTAGTGDGSDTGGSGDSGGDGGDGGDTDPPAPVTALYVATVEDELYYDTTFWPAVTAMRSAAVQDGIRTPMNDLPTSGQLNYAGYMELLIGSTVASANVAGTTALTLTLGNGAIIGSATGFMGPAIDENDIERLVNYDGTILITNGLVTANGSGEAALSVDVDGSLDSGLHVFGVDGTFVGFLYGPGAEGLQARASNTSGDGSMVATVDGGAAQIGVGTISATTSSPTP